MDEMTMANVPSFAVYLMKQHGLLQQGWTFRWDTTKRRAGCCRYGTKTISLSRYFVELNIDKMPEEILDCILHEIAHALVGPKHGHDWVWKGMCRLIGARPERCYDSKQIEMPKGRYLAICGGCGKEFRRHKRVYRGWRYCVVCGRERGRLEFKDTGRVS